MRRTRRGRRRTGRDEEGGRERGRGSRSGVDIVREESQNIR